LLAIERKERREEKLRRKKGRGLAMSLVPRPHRETGKGREKKMRRGRNAPAPSLPPMS